MRKLNEEKIVEEIKRECNKEERALIIENENIFIKVYNIGRLNTINNLLD